MRYQFWYEFYQTRFCLCPVFGNTVTIHLAVKVVFITNRCTLLHSDRTGLYGKMAAIQLQFYVKIAIDIKNTSIDDAVRFFWTVMICQHMFM